MYELAYEQWIEITSRGTSGDQVHNILAAWRVERECLQAENTRLREQLEEIQDDRTARYGNQITAQVRIQKLKQENNHLQAENKQLLETCEDLIRLIEEHGSYVMRAHASRLLEARTVIRRTLGGITGQKGRIR